jgi:membrane-bound inhibitor of C-type lysozyme
MKKIVGLLGLALVSSALAQHLRPQSIIVNPTPPPDLVVRVWVDRDPANTGNPVYRFGENMQISVQVTQQAYVYLFSVGATGQIEPILPNPFEPVNLLRAGEVRTFPSPGAGYTFTVQPPPGQARVLAVASRRPLDVSEIINIQTGEAHIKGAEDLARALSIVVRPIPTHDWATDEAFYIAGHWVPPPTGTLLLHSIPAGAQVWIGGALVGHTPLTLELSPGAYHLELRLSGFHTLRTSFTIHASQATRLNLPLIALPPPTGVLLVESWWPPSVQVWLDGRLVGHTPLSISLSPGFYTVELRQPGFHSFRTRVAIHAGRTSRVSTSLVALPPPPPVRPVPPPPVRPVPPPPVRPVPPPVHPVPPVRPVPTGTVTYTCEGGTLVVNYISPSQVRVFYDGAFHTLTLVRGAPELVFTDHIYTWERGRFGRLLVRGQVVLFNCRI